MTRELPYCSPGGCRHPKRYRLHKALQTSNPSSFCRRAASAIEPTGAEGCRPPPGSSDPGCAFAVCGLGLPLTQRSSPTWKWHWGLAAGSSSRPAGGGRPQAFWPTGHEPAGVGGRDWEVRLLLCPSLLVLLLHHTHVPSPPLHFPTDLLRISWNRITSPPPPGPPHLFTHHHACVHRNAPGCHRKSSGKTGGAFNLVVSDVDSLDSQDCFWGDPQPPPSLQPHRSLISPMPESPGGWGPALALPEQVATVAEESRGWGPAARLQEVLPLRLAFPLSYSE